MEMRKILLALLLSVFILAQASALDDTYQQNRPADILLDHTKYPVCASSCNVTIAYPNTTLLVINVQATKNISYSNLTLTSSQTTVLGNYKVMAFNSTSSGNTGYFEVTPTGYQQSLSSVLIGAVTLLLLFGIGAVLLFFSNHLAENPTYWILGFIGIAIGMLLFYYDLVLAIVYLRDVAYTTQTYDNFEFIFYLAARLQKYAPYFFMVLVVYWWFRKRKNMKKTMMQDDGYDGEK